MSPPRTATVISAALSALLIVGGCTEPQPLGPIEPTTTASATPTKPDTSPTDPTPPTLPAAAKPNTAKGAARFVQHYIDLMNYSASTGDTDAIRDASKDCEGCDNYIALYERTYRDGGYFEDPRWKSRGAVAQQNDGSTVTVLIDVDSPRSKFVLKKGDEVSIGKGGTYRLRFEVEPDGGHWAVTLLAERPDVLP